MAGSCAQAYIDCAAGMLQNYDYPADEIAMTVAGLPALPA
jgi:hypothetical protein